MRRKLNFVIKIFIAICFIFGAHQLFAGSADSILNGLRVEGKIHYGFVYPHTGTIKYLLNNNISGAEITFSTQSNGRHQWENLYRYPRYGIGYNYNDFRNKEILGSSHAFFGYFDAPIYRSRSRFSLSYQIGFGFAVMSNRYKAYENPLNLAISSAVNVYASVDLVARYKVSKKNEIKSALELSHYSNGKTRSPNMGLNTVTMSVAWLYSLKPEKKIVKIVEPVPYKKHIAEIFWNVGGKRDDFLNDKIYMISSIVGDYNFAFSPKYAFGGGFDILYDESIGITKQYRGEGQAELRDNYQAGLHLGLRARYGRMNIILHAGHYLYATFEKYTLIYSRIGIRYALSNQIILNITLKAHYAIADYIEWGIGYRFKTSGI